VPNAVAALTLGKDMTFRDFAQGAFRMRGFGIGQTISLFLTPEVRKLMARHCTLAGMPLERISCCCMLFMHRLFPH
jgi:hypothetical protein